MGERLPEEVLRRVVAEAATAYGVSEEQVRSTAAFYRFRDTDSLGVVELVLALDDELRGAGPGGPALA
jgi:hypothetical protein